MTAPPKINSGSVRFVRIILALIFLSIADVIFFFNPATHSFYPVCEFHRLTGLSCPGCGMTRALYALLHGKIFTALHDNALFVMILGGLLVRSILFGFNKLAGRFNKEFFQIKFVWLLVTIASAFTLLRNLSAFAFLSPEAK
jgi:hypothetical protein